MVHFLQQNGAAGLPRPVSHVNIFLTAVQWTVPKNTKKRDPMKRAPHLQRSLIGGAIALLAASHHLAQAQTPAQTPAQTQAADEQLAKEQTVVVLGSRTAAKTALDTASPVGLISLKDLQTAGPLELGKLLQTNSRTRRPTSTRSSTCSTTSAPTTRPPACS